MISSLLSLLIVDLFVLSVTRIKLNPAETPEGSPFQMKQLEQIEDNFRVSVLNSERSASVFHLCLPIPVNCIVPVPCGFLCTSIKSFVRFHGVNCNSSKMKLATLHLCSTSLYFANNLSLTLTKRS